MSDPITWAQIGTLIGAAGFCGGLLRWILSALAQRDVKIAAVERQISEFKLEAARTYATHAALADSERSMTAVIERVNDNLGAMNKRLDTLLIELLRDREG